MTIAAKFSVASCMLSVAITFAPACGGANDGGVQGGNGNSTASNPVHKDEMAESEDAGDSANVAPADDTADSPLPVDAQPAAPMGTGAGDAGNATVRDAGSSSPVSDAGLPPGDDDDEPDDD